MKIKTLLKLPVVNAVKFRTMPEWQNIKKDCERRFTAKVTRTIKDAAVKKRHPTVSPTKRYSSKWGTQKKKLNISIGVRAVGTYR